LIIDYLNRVFNTAPAAIGDQAPVAATIRGYLSARGRYWPSDAEVRRSVSTRPFYWTGRGTQRIRARVVRSTRPEHGQPPAPGGGSASGQRIGRARAAGWDDFRPTATGAVTGLIPRPLAGWSRRAITTAGKSAVSSAAAVTTQAHHGQGSVAPVCRGGRPQPWALLL